MLIVKKKREERGFAAFIGDEEMTEWGKDNKAGKKVILFLDFDIGVADIYNGSL